MADQDVLINGARISGGGYGFLLICLILTALTATAFSDYELLGKEFAEDGKRLEFCLQRCMEGQIIYYLPEKAVSDLAAAAYVL